MFTKCCEDTLLTIRQNRENILAMLEVNLKSPTKSNAHMTFAGRANSETTASEQDARRKQSKVEIKIVGTDFSGDGLTVSDHVKKLIEAAVNPYNLCRLFPGWKPWC
jgi:phosphatidylinositol kinase/protein kinase (PI-3  family)